MDSELGIVLGISAKIIICIIQLKIMRAFILREPEKLELIDMKAKEPGEEEIQIRTVACGICGTDFHAYHGKHLAVKYPVIPGHEMSGIVSKTGKNITSFKQGDHVVIDPNITCGHCEYCKEGKENFCETISMVFESMVLSPVASTTRSDFPIIWLFIKSSMFVYIISAPYFFANLFLTGFLPMTYIG